VVVLTHAVPQSVRPAPVGHWHRPPKHAAPVSHALPHPPQLDASFITSTQLPEQSIVPRMQFTTHRPPEHARPVAHALPHAPQFSGSSASEVHTPLHSASAPPPPGPAVA
jgi:hypothetical protein